ncbi:MAG: SH3 domain-containing protein [Clostridia bacterium]|nr:SH3 domain-containing protein [Clostridia bacterium]
MKKLTLKFLCLILIISIVFGYAFSFFFKNEVNAAQSSSYTQYIKSGISAFPESYQKQLAYLKYLHPNWEFKAYYTGIEWNELTSIEGRCMTNTIHKGNLLDPYVLCWCGQMGDSGYYCPSVDAVKYYLDPRNFMGEAMVFQFLDLTEGNGITKTEVEKATQGTYLSQYVNDIMAASKEAGISPLHIVATIFQELGKGQDGLPRAISGTVPGYEGLYNFYNYGATDGPGAVERGLAKAKELGWTTPRFALVDGAKKVLAGGYISAGQTTKYFYKFDVVGNEILKESDGKKTYSSKYFFNHQYMTNLRDPSSQAYSLYNDYMNNGKLDSKLTFIIPVYNNMPNAVSKAPSSFYSTGGNLYYINSLGKWGPNFRESPNGSVLGNLYKDTVVELLENQGYWSKIRINKATKFNKQGLTWEYEYQIGYVASEYLQKVGTELPDYRDKVDMGNGNKPKPEEPEKPDIPDSKNMKISGNYIFVTPEVDVKIVKQTYSKAVIKNGETLLSKDDQLVPTGASIEIDKKKYTVIKLGDVNGDGAVKASDYVLIKNNIMDAKTNPLNEIQTKAADVNKDTKVKASDYVLIKNYIMDGTQINI